MRPLSYFFYLLCSRVLFFYHKGQELKCFLRCCLPRTFSFAELKFAIIESRSTRVCVGVCGGGGGGGGPAAGIFKTLPIHIFCKYQNIYLYMYLFAKRHTVFICSMRNS